MPVISHHSTGAPTLKDHNSAGDLRTPAYPIENIMRRWAGLGIQGSGLPGVTEMASRLYDETTRLVDA